MQVETLPSRPYIPLLNEDNVRTGFPETEAFSRVLKHRPSYLQPIATFAYLTDWRAGGILGLTWQQVDFEAATVRLEPGTTKDREGRTIFLTPQLLTLLKHQRAITITLDRQQRKRIP